MNLAGFGRIPGGIYSVMNAMVWYDHFWAYIYILCIYIYVYVHVIKMYKVVHPGVHCTQTKCAVLQEIHDNLNGKGQSLNKAITLSEFGAA